MKRWIVVCFVVAFLANDQTIDARGFGGFRGGFGGGGFSGGGFDRYGGGYSGGFSHSYGSYGGFDRYGGSYSGSRSMSSYSGWGGRSFNSSYDHSWTDARGGSISTSGSRGAYEGRFGGVAAGGNRDTTVTTAGGKTYGADRQGGFASGPMGRTVGGQASGTVDGRYGASSWETAFSGNRYTGDMNHYASIYGANGAHSTAYWSTGYMGTHAAAVRTSFPYYHCFYPGWYARYPGCWLAAGWAAGAAWSAANYSDLSGYCSMPSDPTDYDYGSNVVYQDNNVYINGQDTGTAEQFAQQATAAADAGQAASPPATAEWKPLGVFALVQGDDKSSNNIFQLAINKDGIIRGNYYDGLMDTTTEVFGSVDKKSQRAAWTIGKKKDRVFEAGVYNLTQPQCPCLVHIGTQSTKQMLLVRMDQPKKSQ